MIDDLVSRLHALSEEWFECCDNIHEPLTEAAEALILLRDALADARKRFSMISNFGDPYEISQEPEEFGGTDDGLDTVCMAYENMQQIARNGLTNTDTLLFNPAALTPTKIEKAE